MHEPKVKCASHLEHTLNVSLLRQTIRRAVAVLKHYEFDAIAFRGLSGSLIAPALAVELNKSLIAVRKPEEIRHSSRIVEGDYNAKRYVIVDDLISTGTTARAIVEAIKNEVNSDAICIGVLETMYLNCEEDDQFFEAKLRTPPDPPNNERWPFGPTTITPDSQFPR